MLKNMLEKLNTINSFSVNIIKWGSIFSLIMCMIGIGIIEYNSYETNLVATYTIGSTMVYTAIVAFAQFVVGGLAIDKIGRAHV